MSSVVISGDTSGAITLSAPAVAGTNTITLPASTGTVVTTGSPISGSVIQTVSTNYSTFSSTTSTTPVDTGSLTLSITPKFATSTIQVTWSLAGLCTGDNNSTTRQLIAFVADASNNVVARICDQFIPGGASGQTWLTMAGTYKASPATTSALTYKIRWYSPSSASLVINNYVSNAGTMSNITVMEIAA
jgi:hypothetical protein